MSIKGAQRTNLSGKQAAADVSIRLRSTSQWVDNGCGHIAILVGHFSLNVCSITLHSVHERHFAIHIIPSDVNSIFRRRLRPLRAGGPRIIFQGSRSRTGSKNE